CTTMFLYLLHISSPSLSFFFTDPSTSHIYTLSLHDALPISSLYNHITEKVMVPTIAILNNDFNNSTSARRANIRFAPLIGSIFLDRKSTRLNSSHVSISYAVFCLKKKKSI